MTITINRRIQASNFVGDAVVVDSLLFEDFSYSSPMELPIVRPTYVTSPYLHNGVNVFDTLSNTITVYNSRLWGGIPDHSSGQDRPCYCYIESGTGYSGGNAMRFEVDFPDVITNSGIQFHAVQYFPYDEPLFEYRFMREQKALTYNANSETWEAGVDSWEIGKFDRVEFYVKVDSFMGTVPDGQTNFHFGTYWRGNNSNRSKEQGDSGEEGDHFYHYYNLDPVGDWYKVIVDTHISHKVGGNGNTEWGDQLYPSGDAVDSGYTYFDLMTRFYFHEKSEVDSFTGSNRFLFSDIRIYKEQNNEDRDKIYSLSAVHDSANSQVIVAWKRDKDDNDVFNQVRYAYSNIHSLGWTNANCIDYIDPPSTAGYNGVKFIGDLSSMGYVAQDEIFIGIKSDSSTLFRQISIDL